MRTRTRKRSHCDLGAVSFETVFVVGLTAVTLFVLFPPILRQLNIGAEQTRSESFFVGKMGEKNGITYIDPGGSVYLASPDIVISGIQTVAAAAQSVTASDALSIVGVTQTIDTASSTCSVANPCVSTCGSSGDAVTNGYCCQRFNGSFSYCQPADLTALIVTAQKYPNHDATNPYSMPAQVYANGKLLSDAVLPTKNLPLNNTVGSQPTWGGSGFGGFGCGGGASSMYWGEITTEVARGGGGKVRCPLRAEDPQICCGVTASGTFDLNTCGTCTVLDLQGCVFGG